MPRLSRTPVTWLIYGQLGVWGYFLYGFGPAVPLLRDEQGTTAAVASLHGTALAAGGLIGGALFPVLVRRIGRAGTMWLALAGLVIGAGALCTFRELPATLASTAACAVCGTQIVNGVVAMLSDQHGRLAPAAISEANAVAAGLGVLAPVVVGLGVRAGWSWRPGVAAVVGLIAAIAVVSFLARVRLPARPATAPADPADPSASSVGAVGPVGREPTGVIGGGSGGLVDGRPDGLVDGRPDGRPVAGALPRAYWVAWGLLIMTAAIEVSVSLWAADVLRGHASMSAGAASAAVASVIGGMFLGRLAGGRLAATVPPAILMIAALTISIGGFAVFWLATAPWLAVTGLMVLGVGISMHYPLAISMAMLAADGQPDRAAGYASYAISIGFGVAPVALGWFADGVGAHLAFLLLPLFIAAAALLTVRLGRALATTTALEPEPVRIA